MSAKTFLSADAQAAVSAAIAAAEERTSAEIVCALATESGRYDRAEALLGLICALLGLLSVNLLTEGAAGGGSWEEAARIPYALQAAGVVFGFLAGNVLASYVHPLRRVFVGAGEAEAEVARAASHVFVNQRLASTRAKGGVLLYVSLFERRVLVLADEGAFAVLGQAGVDALRDQALAKLRAGERGATFEETVAAIAERLAGALPREVDDANELADELLVYHPRP